MNVEQVYQEARQKAVQQGILQGIQQGVQQGIQQGVQQGVKQGIPQGRLEMQRTFVESLLKSRFGKVDRTLSKVIDPLVQFSPQEVTDWLLQKSREELIAEFGKKRVGGKK